MIAQGIRNLFFFKISRINAAKLRFIKVLAGLRFLSKLGLTIGLAALVFAVPSHAQNSSPAAPFEPDPRTQERGGGKDALPLDTRTAIRNAFLANTSASLPAGYTGIDSVLAFYAARDFEPAWTEGETARQMAGLAIGALANAQEQGLRGEDYGGDWKNPPSSTDEIVRYELSLTRAVLRYARDVRMGRRAPGAIYRDAAFAQEPFSAVSGLANALKNRALPRFFAGLPPPHPQYRRLVQALQRYRAIEARGGWEALVAPPKGIKLDSGDPWLSLLARRLASEDGRLFPFVRSAEELREAILHFQNRNGIKATGVPDEETLAALNRPVQDRILQIIANMERWRWLPRNLERAYIAVNVPDQTAEFVRDGRAAASSKVVVGRKANPTPLTRTEIEALVLNPPWNIPGFIAARDLLPRLQKNRRYLQTKNMVIVDGPTGDPYGIRIDWRTITPDAFPYALRQLPGPATALGKLMLDSPNDFDVYLHDTPNKDYFALSDRGLSNGCVRVENIFDFAALALADAGQEGKEDDVKKALIATIADRQTSRIALKSPLPVYLLYWTAFTSQDGVVNFRDDRYGRDTALYTALQLVPAPALEGAPFAAAAPDDVDMEEDITP
jgi:L,D-transpeptidase YcbB